MKKFLFIMFALLCILTAPAIAEPRTYVFGGSGYDSLEDIAVGGDGRIVMTGYTDSTDGTLADRTKTGRSGWALCIDDQGNVLWSFCSRLGKEDTMRAPVFHEDGSVSVVLDSKTYEGASAMELIRLDTKGEVISRRTMRETVAENALTLEGATRAGVVLSEWEHMAPCLFCGLYGWDGAFIREVSTLCVGVSHQHMLYRDEDGGALCAVDEQGIETMLASWIRQENEYEYGLISLSDGGAAAIRDMHDDSKEPLRLLRWDAQGDLVCDEQIEGLNRGNTSLCQTGNGLAMTYCPEDSSLDDGEEWYSWYLAFFDAQGRRTGTLRLGNAIYACKTATLPDGGVVAVQPFIEDGMPYDVRVTIVPKEDVP